MQPGTFFREPRQFELLAGSVLPALARAERSRSIGLLPEAAKQRSEERAECDELGARMEDGLRARPTSRRIRLWSAGCGTGEDAWSMAMIVAEAKLPPALEVEIVATDGDRRALRLAGEAVYRDEQMQPVNAERRRRHFVRGVGPRRGLWRVIAPLRDRVEIDELDLAGRWPAYAPFHAVFCGGPIAGLDPRGAHRLARRFAEVLAPGGALFLGRAPGAPDDLPGLVPWGPNSYRKATR